MPVLNAYLMARIAAAIAFVGDALVMGISKGD